MLLILKQSISVNALLMAVVSIYSWLDCQVPPWMQKPCANPNPCKWKFARLKYISYSAGIPHRAPRSKLTSLSLQDENCIRGMLCYSTGFSSPTFSMADLHRPRAVERVGIELWVAWRQNDPSRSSDIPTAGCWIGRKEIMNDGSR